MRNTIGHNVSLTIFGESHGKAIGAVLDGMPSGIRIEDKRVEEALAKRRPRGTFSTSRVEKDEFEIVSGVFNGYTTGSPICIVIPNKDVDDSVYEEMDGRMRPSHADYTAHVKYKGFEDYRGGGHFSGRLTAAIVAAGAVAQAALDEIGIKIGTHLSKCAGVSDRGFADAEKDIDCLKNKDFPVLDDKAAEKIIKEIEKAKTNLDSVGGISETAVLNIPCGVGEPFFDSIESQLSHALFSIPAIKGVEFGAGFAIADMTGSTANDRFEYSDGRIVTKTNYSGGINGGISNGMPVTFRCAIKPTPSIGQKQDTIDIKKNENAELTIKGRHDPCIAHRVCPVIDALTAVIVCDILSQTYGLDFTRIINRGDKK